MFVPAGVQHAIGAGLLILEVQQASNTTFRVFDWNRVDQNGKPRELHLEQALAITDFQMGPVNPVSKPPLIQNERLLISCPYFAVRECLGPKTGYCGFRDRFQIVVCIEGQARIGNEVLRIGETALLPPNPQYYECELSEHTTVIQIWIP